MNFSKFADLPQNVRERLRFTGHVGGVPVYCEDYTIGANGVLKLKFVLIVNNTPQNAGNLSLVEALAFSAHHKWSLRTLPSLPFVKELMKIVKNKNGIFTFQAEDAGSEVVFENNQAIVLDPPAPDDAPRCACGKLVAFWSAKLEKGFCSEACYWLAEKEKS